MHRSAQVAVWGARVDSRRQRSMSSLVWRWGTSSVAGIDRCPRRHHQTPPLPPPPPPPPPLELRVQRRANLTVLNRMTLHALRMHVSRSRAEPCFVARTSLRIASARVRSHRAHACRKVGQGCRRTGGSRSERSQNHGLLNVEARTCRCRRSALDKVVMRA